MFIGCLWVMVGAALQCSAQNLAWYVRASMFLSRLIRIHRMLCARVINGIGTGYLNAIVPVWSAEVATHTSRGLYNFLLTGFHFLKTSLQAHSSQLNSP